MKGTLRGFGKSLAREWAPHGMPMNMVSPLALVAGHGQRHRAGPGYGERLDRRVPLGRVGDPEPDVGRAVVFLV